jgi:hypothetical protein
MVSDHDKAMAYLHDQGLGGAPEPDLELPDYEAYFLSKSLEELIESGKDILEKTFNMQAPDGTMFEATFRLCRTIVP